MSLGVGAYQLVEPGNALAWGGGIHGNPASGPHQGTVTLNNSVEYLPTHYLPSPKPQVGGRNGKTKAQTGSKTAGYCKNTLRRTASKPLRI